MTDNNIKYRYNYDTTTDTLSNKPDTGAKTFIAMAVTVTAVVVFTAVKMFG